MGTGNTHVDEVSPSSGTCFIISVVKTSIFCSKMSY